MMRVILLLCVLCATVVSVTPTPTGTGTGTGTADLDIPDRGTYWPWNTPRGVLPDTIPSSSINPVSDLYSYHVVWQTVSNSNSNSNSNTSTDSPYPMGTLKDSYITSNHSYYRATFSYYSAANTFFMKLSNLDMSNVVFIGSGATYYTKISSIVGNDVFPRLLLRYSYLILNNRIPSSIDESYYSYTTYYLTARSFQGEFRMITYTDINSMNQAYQSITQQYASPSQRYWDTVKVYYGGDVYLSDTVSRGSELEHQGAFQWLSIPVSYYRYSSPYTYYLLISFTSLSGVQLERMHVFSDYYSAWETQQWLSWYTNTYDGYSSRASSLIYNNQRLYNSIIQPGFDITSIQRHFNWITGTTITTSSPTYNPYDPYNPYNPYNPTPTPDPNYPIYAPTDSLTTSEMTFFIAYPTSLIVAAVVILLMVGCCMKRRYDNVSPSTCSVPRGMTCFVIFLSLMSLILLIISISLKQFTQAPIGRGYSLRASYGPFQVDPMYYVSLRKLYHATQIISPIIGICMIISMIASSILIILIIIKHHVLSYRILLLSLIAWLFSLCATLVWIPIQVGQFARDQMGLPLQRTMGTGYIMLICASAIQLFMFYACLIIHRKYHNHTTTTTTTSSTHESQQELEGLQYVSPTSPYYYRDVPTSTNPSSTVMAVPVPTYMYGVQRPTAPPTAPPPFMFAAVPASGYPYTAPMYHPPPPAPAAAAPAAVVEPLNQPISVPAPYTVPTAYPSLPVDQVPASGPNTNYQRLL